MDDSSKAYFRDLEGISPEDEIPFAELIDRLAFDEAGLLPAIAQDAETGEVLMLAWMNRAALEKTIATGRMTYWSRSRQSFWVKGETSGHFQQVESISFDCDGDAVLCQVRQTGSACHTHRRSCFYLKLDGSGERVTLSTSPQD